MIENIKSYIKEIIEKAFWFYKTDEKYKSLIKGITIVAVIAFFNFYRIFVIDKGYLDFKGVLFPIIIWSFIWLAAITLFTFLIVPSDRIEPDMDKLPKKVGKAKVVIEYTPPKWISPSEAWLIYYLYWERSNFECLLYKRESEWLITRKEDDISWHRMIIRNGELKYNVPKYEREFRNEVFWIEHKERVSELQLKKRKIIKKSQYALLKDCIEKDLLIGELPENKKQQNENNKDEKSDLSDIITLFLVGLILIPAMTAFLVIIILIYFIKRTDNRVCLWNLERTEKWDEIYAHLIWYKYFLEHCEEKQMKKILKDDPDFKDKTIPYMIALRMDRKFLDKEYLKA